MAVSWRALCLVGVGFLAWKVKERKRKKETENEKAEKRREKGVLKD